MMSTTTNYGSRCKFNVSCDKFTTLVLTHSLRVKYVVCSPTKVVLDLIELFPSAVWRSCPSLAAKKIYEELDITNVCARNLSSLYFSTGKITTEALMHSFRVASSVLQSDQLRIWLNLIEFIQSNVWRSFDSCTGKFYEECLQNPAAFVLNLFGGNSNFRWRK